MRQLALLVLLCAMAGCCFLRRETLWTGDFPRPEPEPTPRENLRSDAATDYDTTQPGTTSDAPVSAPAPRWRLR